MTSISKFDTEIYSEELHQVTESEYDEVMSLMAEDESEWQGYGEWVADIESAAWDSAQEFNGILIKKACEHTSCPHTRCEREVRLGGIAI
jgi:hypothetical protein